MEGGGQGRQNERNAISHSSSYGDVNQIVSNTGAANACWIRRVRERVRRADVALYDTGFHARTLDRLSALIRARLDALLLPADDDTGAGCC
jgi:hypothetical protein